MTFHGVDLTDVVLLNTSCYHYEDSCILSNHPEVFECSAMSTLQPRPPYTDSELRELYPKQLELSLVQIILRHGERAPTSVRFQNTGLSQHWSYCSAAKKLRSVALTDDLTTAWDTLNWRRRLETFGEADDRSMVAAGPSGGVDGVCQPGELTDQGRRSTYRLGQRLRQLYVHQLGFMPELLSNMDLFYLRATEVSRAIESTQQTWLGMYPTNTRTAIFPPMTIITRPLKEETLIPNDFHCQKYKRLFREFGKHTAEKWKDSTEVEYLNKKISKWMPLNSSKIAVDSQPSIHGMLDTIYATLAHGPDTRLPEDFYDPKVLDVIDKIACDEWYGGHSVNREFRTLGTGAFAADIVDRMVTKVEELANLPSITKTCQLRYGPNNQEQGIRFALYGCHDVTLAAFLASFGAYENPTWPKFSSHIAIELFRRKEMRQPRPGLVNVSNATESDTSRAQSSITLSHSLVPGQPDSTLTNDAARSDSTDMIRRFWSDYTVAEKKKLDGYYVRLRYNDHILRLPGCAAFDKHLEDNPAFCTLEAFKRIVDGFTPKDWRSQCAEELGSPIAGMVKGTEQRAGYIEEGF